MFMIGLSWAAAHVAPSVPGSFLRWTKHRRDQMTSHRGCYGLMVSLDPTALDHALPLLPRNPSLPPPFSPDNEFQSCGGLHEWAGVPGNTPVHILRDAFRSCEPLKHDANQQKRIKASRRQDVSNGSDRVYRGHTLPCPDEIQGKATLEGQVNAATRTDAHQELHDSYSERFAP